VRIIPIVLSIFAYTYGPLLGVFLCGMFTERRGNDVGNIVAMITGFLFVAIISNLFNAIAGVFGVVAYVTPAWFPAVAWPWWICFGTIVTFVVAITFRTGHEHRPPAA